MIDPKVKQQLEVLFWSTALPAQSASAYPYDLMSVIAQFVVGVKDGWKKGKLVKLRLS
jgi:hypothetical protein